MRRYDRIILASLLCGVIIMTACSSTQGSPSSHGMDYKTLLKNLQAHDTSVVPAGDVSQPFMNAQGHIIKIRGEQIQVYEYTTVSDADTQASHTSSDGSTFTVKSLTGTSGTAVDWIAPPHFYKQGRVIVLYVGRNSTIIKTLTNMLGRQFVGA